VRKMTTAKRDERGFTLVELLVVLAILALLTALAGPALFNQIKPARREAAAVQIEHFGSALDAYFLDMGSYPSTADGLEALRTAPGDSKRWRGPYLKKEIPMDPWGNPYHYKSPGRSGPYEISSYGADGREGGEGEDADINSWQAH
jgi:general secretion pathway protein G